MSLKQKVLLSAFLMTGAGFCANSSFGQAQESPKADTANHYVMTGDRNIDFAHDDDEYINKQKNEGFSLKQISLDTLKETGDRVATYTFTKTLDGNDIQKTVHLCKKKGDPSNKFDEKNDLLSASYLVELKNAKGELETTIGITANLTKDRSLGGLNVFQTAVAVQDVGAPIAAAQTTITQAQFFKGVKVGIETDPQGCNGFVDNVLKRGNGVSANVMPNKFNAVAPQKFDIMNFNKLGFGATTASYNSGNK